MSGALAHSCFPPLLPTGPAQSPSLPVRVPSRPPSPAPSAPAEPPESPSDKGAAQLPHPRACPARAKGGTAPAAQGPPLALSAAPSRPPPSPGLQGPQEGRTRGFGSCAGPAGRARDLGPRRGAAFGWRLGLGCPLLSGQCFGISHLMRTKGINWWFRPNETAVQINRPHQQKQTEP